jgi:hypothetical protein
MEELIESLEGSMKLSEGEKTGILITEEDTVELRLKSGCCLIGRVMSDRNIRKEALCALMTRLWRTAGEVAFEELYDNIWLIEFSIVSDKKRVQEGRHWLFDRSVFVLKEVDENVPPLQKDFFKSPFWIQVHNLPLVCTNREVGLKI